MFDAIIEKLVAALTPDRALMLAELNAEASTAATTLDSLSGERLLAVERLAMIAALQPKLDRAYFKLLARVQASAIAVRQEFDNEVPPDLVASFRAARQAKTDNDVTSALNIVKREVARHVGNAQTVSRTLDQMRKDLETLGSAGDAISNKKFVVAEPAPGSMLTSFTKWQSWLSG